LKRRGIHSGDSACCIPPYSLKQNVIDEISKQTKKIAFGLKVLGLLNIQFAVKDDRVYVLEVNPRASRTVPFVAKSIGVPVCKNCNKSNDRFKIKRSKFK
jgi:carbamoyl-phosphate synthase large subunit